MSFPDGSVVTSEMHGFNSSGRSPEGGNGHPFQYSCLENPMERGAWPATVHGDMTEHLAP